MCKAGVRAGKPGGQFPLPEVGGECHGVGLGLTRTLLRRAWRLACGGRVSSEEGLLEERADAAPGADRAVVGCPVDRGACSKPG